jgi:hypothetical protein
MIFVLFIKALENSWPRIFGKDIVSTPGYGNIAAKRIYSVTMLGYKDESSIKVHRTLGESRAQLALFSYASNF